MNKNDNVSMFFDTLPKLFTKNDRAGTITDVISKNNNDDVDIIRRNSKKSKRKLALTAEILLSSDGLPKIYKEFPESCKFRGKGYENQDLKNMLRSYREWAWMILPGTSFVDFVMKCEQLGNNIEVKTAMNRYRQSEKEHFRMRKITPQTKKKIVSFKSKDDVVSVSKFVDSFHEKMTRKTPNV
jgi:hypothetical protein